MNDSTNANPGGPLEKVAAKAKQAVGRLIGNDDLAEEGALQEAKVEAEADAARKAAEARIVEDAAEVAGAREANRIEQQRVAAELAADRAVERIDEDRARAQTAVDRAADERGRVVERAREADQARLGRETAAALADQSAEVAGAAALDSEAETATATADALAAAQDTINDQRKGA